MAKGNDIQSLRWWHVDTFDYRELLGRETTQLTGVTASGKLIREEVALREENQTVIAKTQDGEEFYLLPNSWITPQTETIDGFWLANANDFSSNEIKKIYEIIESGKVWADLSSSDSYELYGNKPGGIVAKRTVASIVPLGNGKYVASDGIRSYVIRNRETDKIAIDLAMTLLA